jgi:hypothetical protein
MTGMRMLWDTGSRNTSRVMDKIVPRGHMMVQYDSMIGSDM